MNEPMKERVTNLAEAILAIRHVRSEEDARVAAERLSETINRLLEDEEGGSDDDLDERPDHQ